MTLLRGVAWEDCLLEKGKLSPELEQFLRDQAGIVSPVSAYFAPVPWVPRAQSTFSRHRFEMTHLGLDLTDLIGLVVSQDNSCLSRASPLPSAADSERLVDAGWSPEAVKEIALVTAAFVSTNRLTTIPALPPQRVERLSEGLLLKLASLVLGRRLRAKRDEPRRVDASPEPAKGPYAYLVWALEGLPGARTVAEILEFDSAPTTLSTRTKAFIHAVVARGVGARVAEQEAVEPEPARHPTSANLG